MRRAGVTSLSTALNWTGRHYAAPSFFVSPSGGVAMLGTCNVGTMLRPLRAKAEAVER